MAVALGLWLSLPAWGGRLPAGDDVMAHVVRSEFGLEHVFGRGRLDGWFPRFMVGHQEFLFYGPGFTVLVGLLRVVTFGLLSVAGAIKVLAVASLVAVGPAAAFAARSVALSRRAAGVAAVLAVAVDNPFGLGITSLFGIGLLPSQVAAVLTLLAFGACVRAATGAGRAWWGPAVALAAAVALTHLISALILAVLLALALPFLPVPARSRAGAGARDVVVRATRSIARLAGVGVAAVGVSAFWLIPLVAHRSERGTVTTWATPPIGDRLAAVWRGEILFDPVVSRLTLAGLAAAAALAATTLLRRSGAAPGTATGEGGRGQTEANRPPWLLILALPVAYLVLAHTAASALPGNEAAMQLANRGLGLAGIFALFPLAALASQAWSWAASRLGPRAPWSAIATGAVALVAAALVATPPAHVRSRVAQLPAVVPEMDELAAELADRVPDGARFATERDFPGEIARLGVSHPDLWLAARSGVNTLNIFNQESSPAPRAGFQAEELGVTQSPAQTARVMAALGVTHVVTVEAATAAHYLASGDHLTPEWSAGSLALFRVKAPPGQPPASSLLSSPPFPGWDVALVGWSPELMRWEATGWRPGWVTVAAGWSPKWHARTAEGDRLDVRRSGDGLVEVRLPEGGRSLTWTLAYRPDRWDVAGPLVSALVVAGLVGAPLWRRRPR